MSSGPGALHLPLDYAGFDPSSLSCFRRRLAEHGQERNAFDRLMAVARQAGFLPDRVTLLVDTTWVKGAGAVQDTYTLLRKRIRKLLRALGYAVPSKRHGSDPHVQRLIASYLEKDRKVASAGDSRIPRALPAAESRGTQAGRVGASRVTPHALCGPSQVECSRGMWLLN